MSKRFIDTHSHKAHCHNDSVIHFPLREVCPCLVNKGFVTNSSQCLIGGAFLTEFGKENFKFSIFSLEKKKQIASGNDWLYCSPVPS